MSSNLNAVPSGRNNRDGMPKRKRGWAEPLTAVGQLGQASPRVILNVLRVLEQNVRDEMERPLGILIGTYQHSAAQSRRSPTLPPRSLLHSILTFLPSPARRSNLRYAKRNQPVGKTHSGPWWYYSDRSARRPYLTTRHNYSQRCQPNRLTFQPFATLWSVESFELS